MKYLIVALSFSVLFASCGADINVEPRFFSDDTNETRDEKKVLIKFISECRDDTEFLMRIEGRRDWSSYQVGDVVGVPTHVWYEIKVVPRSGTRPHKEIRVSSKPGPHLQEIGDVTKWYPTVSGLVMIDYCA